jgi:hypothetical protein
MEQRSCHNPMLLLLQFNQLEDEPFDVPVPSKRTSSEASPRSLLSCCGCPAPSCPIDRAASRVAIPPGRDSNVGSASQHLAGPSCNTNFSFTLFPLAPSQRTSWARLQQPALNLTTYVQASHTHVED